MTVIDPQNPPDGDPDALPITQKQFKDAMGKLHDRLEKTEAAASHKVDPTALPPTEKETFLDELLGK